MKQHIIFFSLLLILLSSCSGSNFKYEKTALDNIVTKYINEPSFSVILADMDYNESTDKYRHKYQIIVEKPQIKVDDYALNDSTQNAKDIEIIEKDWIEVNAIEFEKHVEDLGMVLISKKNGVIDKNISPAGLDNYVGNERYGQWSSHSNGSSFWAFYGQYYFLSRILCGPSYYYPRSVYSSYNSTYRGRRSYYGTGNNNYGTKSSNTRGSTWSNKPSSFKSSVRSKVKKSATSLKSSRSSRTTRNSSRYSNSSSRSRGGGFGK